jgi:hypothetical protein
MRQKRRRVVKGKGLENGRGKHKRERDDRRGRKGFCMVP